MERPQQITEDQVNPIRSNYRIYEDHVRGSSVPASFLEASTALRAGFTETPINEIAGIMLGEGFESDQEAWHAIRYAERIAEIKKFHVGIIEDEEGPIVSRDQIVNLYATIDSALDHERGDGGRVKQRVENYFRDPVNQMRIDYLAQSLGSLIQH